GPVAIEEDPAEDGWSASCAAADGDIAAAGDRLSDPVEAACERLGGSGARMLGGAMARAEHRRYGGDEGEDEKCRAHLPLIGAARALELYWLVGYGGGVFCPFADATSSGSTYGGGRYLLDTVKGADLGGDDRQLVLDFNFAYNPSCSYDPRWVCLLTPPANRL